MLMSLKSQSAALAETYRRTTVLADFGVEDIGHTGHQFAMTSHDSAVAGTFNVKRKETLVRLIRHQAFPCRNISKSLNRYRVILSHRGWEMKRAIRTSAAYSLVRGEPIMVVKLDGEWFAHVSDFPNKPSKCFP